jgi:hypothetical protein
MTCMSSHKDQIADVCTVNISIRYLLLMSQTRIVATIRTLTGSIARRADEDVKREARKTRAISRLPTLYD